MPSVVQRVAAGLLSIIDNNQVSATPREIAETLVPTVELRDLYESNAGLEIVQVIEGGAALAGQYATVTIPDGELWSVRSVSCYGLSNANGNRAEFAIEISSISGVATPSLLLQISPAQLTTVTAANSIMGVSESWSPGLLLRGGTDISTYVTNLFSGPWACRTTVLFSRLSI